MAALLLGYFTQMQPLKIILFLMAIEKQYWDHLCVKVIQGFITTTRKINGHIPTVSVNNYDASVVKKCEQKADLRNRFSFTL